MRNLAAVIGSVILLILVLKCLTIGVNRAEIEHNRELIDKTNERMAEMFDELSKEEAPCELEGFEILKEK